MILANECIQRYNIVCKWKSRYNLPTAAEIAVIIPDEGSNIGYRDIVLHRKSSDVPNLPPIVNIHGFASV